jgi:hypothetical protein
VSPTSTRAGAGVDGGTSGQLDAGRARDAGATRARRGPMRVFLPNAGNTAL